MPKNACRKIRAIRDFYASEMTEHDIVNKLTIAREKVARNPNNKRAQKMLSEYGEYMDAMDGLDNATQVICQGEGQIDCDKLCTARRSLGDEIRKYKVLIKLGRKEKHFAEMLRDFDDIMTGECGRKK